MISVTDVCGGPQRRTIEEVLAKMRGNICHRSRLLSPETDFVDFCSALMTNENLTMFLRDYLSSV